MIVLTTAALPQDRAAAREVGCDDYVDRIGTKAGPIARWMLRGRKTKHWMRTIYALTSLRKLKQSLHTARGRDDYWQAGRSVAGIDGVLPVAEVIRRMTALER